MGGAGRHEPLQIGKAHHLEPVLVAQRVETTGKMPEFIVEHRKEAFRHLGGAAFLDQFVEQVHVGDDQVGTHQKTGAEFPPAVIVAHKAAGARPVFVRDFLKLRAGQEIVTQQRTGLRVPACVPRHRQRCRAAPLGTPVRNRRDRQDGRANGRPPSTPSR